MLWLSLFEGCSFDLRQSGAHHMLSSEKPQQLQMGGVLVVTDETQKERRVGENKKKESVEFIIFNMHWFYLIKSIYIYIKLLWTHFIFSERGQYDLANCFSLIKSPPKKMKLKNKCTEVSTEYNLSQCIAKLTDHFQLLNMIANFSQINEAIFCKMECQNFKVVELLKCLAFKPKFKISSYMACIIHYSERPGQPYLWYQQMTLLCLHGWKLARPSSSRQHLR
jgi:hypothetical protein